MSATSVGEISLDLVVNSKQFKKQMSGITGLAKKAGAALAGAFAVKKIVDFGKQCVELGSDLAEVQNVVDTVFPSMRTQVDKFAKSAANSFGLSETMAKKFTGTFGAMAKSFGFSEQAAYDMSSTLTGLAGDIASFYNISQDEAYTKLKSVFTGETESLKDLGVVMTQSALDAYAMANGFGKTTQAMSEAEKVALRYAFVQDKLSAASGDFAKTSGSWANQVRILKLQWESFMATVGQGLINLFTPVIKVINSLLGKLITLGNAFKSFTELITGKSGKGSSGGISNLGTEAAGASVGLENASVSAGNLADNTASVGKAAQKAAKQMRALMGFDKIQKLDAPQSTDTGSTGSGGGVSGGGGSIGSTVDFGTLAQGETIIDEVDNKFTKMFENIKRLCDPATNALKRLWNEGLSRLGNFAWGSLKDFYSHFLVPVGKWTLGTGIPQFVDALNNGLMKVNFDKISGSLRGLWDALAPFAVKVGEGLLWFWQNVLVPFGTWTANEVVPRFLDTLSTAIGAFNEILTALQPLFQWFWDSVLQPIAQWTGGIFLSLWDGINDALQKFSDWCIEHIPTIDSIKKAFEGMHEWLTKNETVLQLVVVAIGTFTTALGLNALASNAASIAMGATSAAIGIYNGITAIATTATSAFGAVIGFLTSPITLVVAAIGGLVAAGILVYKNWDVIKEKAIEIWGAIRDWFEKTTEKIKEFFANLWAGIKETFKNVGDWFKEKFDAAWKNVNNAWKGACDFFSDLWDGITEAFADTKDWFTGIFQDAWDGITGVWESVVTWFSDNVTTPLRDLFEDVFNGLADIARTPINAIIGVFNGIISVINGLIGKINSICFAIDIPDWLGGGYWGFNGFNIPYIGEVPYLAQGGYVKPNTPQLAIIGDNRHQGEIVAPEDKLKEMAMEAVRAAGGSGITRDDLERIINSAVLRIVAALASMGFYVDSEKMAKAMQTAIQSSDMRFNPVEFD